MTDALPVFISSMSGLVVPGLLIYLVFFLSKDPLCLEALLNNLGFQHFSVCLSLAPYPCIPLSCLAKQLHLQSAVEPGVK